jgi:hypothetical protein
LKQADVAKLALALGGMVTFGVGVRAGNGLIRWTGIGLVAFAWLMRFVKDRNDT